MNPSQTTPFFSSPDATSTEERHHVTTDGRRSSARSQTSTPPMHISFSFLDEPEPLGPAAQAPSVSKPKRTSLPHSLTPIRTAPLPPTMRPSPWSASALIERVDWSFASPAAAASSVSPSPTFVGGYASAPGRTPPSARNPFGSDQSGLGGLATYSSDPLVWSLFDSTTKHPMEPGSRRRPSSSGSTSECTPLLPSWMADLNMGELPSAPHHQQHPSQRRPQQQQQQQYHPAYPMHSPTVLSRRAAESSANQAPITNRRASVSGASTSAPGRVPTDRELKQMALYKTEMCRSFEETGRCHYGDRCHFAHSAAELRKVERHSKYKTEICRTFWEQGSCPYGKRCCFIHTEREDGTFPQGMSSSSSTALRQQQQQQNQRRRLEERPRQQQQQQGNRRSSRLFMKKSIVKE